jgi:hypothetical protein
LFCYWDVLVRLLQHAGRRCKGGVATRAWGWLQSGAGKQCRATKQGHSKIRLLEGRDNKRDHVAPSWKGQGRPAFWQQRTSK